MEGKEVPEIWWKWLIAASIFLIIFGVLMLFFNSTLLKPMGRDTYNSFFEDNPFDSISNAEREFQNWIVGVLGAVAIGWGILMIFVAYYPFRRGEKWAWNGLAVSIGIWYILDTGTSLYHGVTLNAVANTGFLIIFGIPLFKSRKYF